MKAQILTATLLTAFSGALSAADLQLLNLVMPDAKVLAGVNVEQAKGTQFGQYVLNQMQTQDAQLQQLVALTGFDPRRDVRELLVASDGVPQGKTGLALAKGNFDAAKIAAAATLHGVVTEVYNGVTILEEPKKQEAGIAFLDATTVAAGDIASVKGAIDRLKTPQSLPAEVAVKVNQWSNSQDAWGITTVPPTSLAPTAKAGAQNPMLNAGQNVQAAAGGIKFGAQVVFSGEAQCDTAQNATTLGDVVKLLINLAQMQAGQDPTAAALIKSVTVTASGNVVKIVASLPQDVFQQMLQSQKKMGMSGMGAHKK
jgi:ABC-type thiamine transport system substrate-binding protein